MPPVAAAPAATATFADLEKVRERAELIDGEIVMMTPAGFWHGRVAVRIGHLLEAHCEQHPRGKDFLVLGSDPGFIWDERTVRAPDVAVVDATRSIQAPEQGWIPFPPRLAIEVVSPSDAWSDVKAKARGWLAHGALAVWVADPRTRTVEVFLPGKPAVELAGDDAIDGGEALPGFACAVSQFFC
jgi:Uma2 family endonuclease